MTGKNPDTWSLPIYIDRVHVDGMGSACVVDDMPASGPIERETLDPGDHILWYCPRHGEPCTLWLRVDARYEKFVRAGHLQIPYHQILASSYTSITGTDPRNRIVEWAS